MEELKALEQKTKIECEIQETAIKDLKRWRKPIKVNSDLTFMFQEVCK